MIAQRRVPGYNPLVRQQDRAASAPPRDGSSLTGLEEVAAAGWLTSPGAHELFAQTLYQQDGLAITLPLAEAHDAVRTPDWDPPRFRR